VAYVEEDYDTGLGLGLELGRVAYVEEDHDTGLGLGLGLGLGRVAYVEEDHDTGLGLGLGFEAGWRTSRKTMTPGTRACSRRLMTAT
jgi:hypothetical protein